MISFHLKRNLLTTIFIIVFIGIVWLFIMLVSSIFTADDKGGERADEITNYTEKIDHFILQEFNEKQQLSHFIEAKNYFNFEQKPALLIAPKVVTYNETGEEVYTMSSERANYLDNGEIKFKGKVDINSKTGVTYKMHAKELLASTKTNDLTSHQEVIYLDKRAKVIAQGMHMKIAQDKMQLLGRTRINQDEGQKILTRDLLIDQSNSKKHYYSKNNTTYLTSDSKIRAEGIDMDMHKNLIKLLGKVEISQKSGTNIDTKSLTIDQSNGKEIYQTKEKVHYKSEVLDVRSTGMYYNVKGKNQKIRLTGGVVGRYE